MSKIVMPIIAMLVGIVFSVYLAPIAGVIIAVILVCVALQGQEMLATISGNKSPPAKDSSDLAPTIISQSISINDQCVKDLNNVLTTQNDAVITLSNCFIKLQSIIASQNQILNSLISDVSGHIEANDREEKVQSAQHALQQLYAKENLDYKNDKLALNIDDAIRSLQFGDINGQNIAFTVETLNLYNKILTDVSDSNDEVDMRSIKMQLVELQEQRLSGRNPVSAKNISAGEVELF